VPLTLLNQGSCSRSEPLLCTITGAPLWKYRTGNGAGPGAPAVYREVLSKAPLRAAPEGAESPHPPQRSLASVQLRVATVVAVLSLYGHCKVTVRSLLGHCKVTCGVCAAFECLLILRCLLLSQGSSAANDSCHQSASGTPDPRAGPIAGSPGCLTSLATRWSPNAREVQIPRLA